MENHRLGIDIGGTGTKGAIVDISTGALVTERFRIPTPQPATPENIVKGFKTVCDHFNWSGPIGCGFPAVIKDGQAKTASNIDSACLDFPFQEAFQEASDCPVVLMNDADVAGVAEVTFGAGKDLSAKLIVMLTIGTGIGSAPFLDGRLIPNSELGHVGLFGGVAERFVSAAARKRDNLDWPEWADRFNIYLQLIEKILNPDVIILGGGGSKSFKVYASLLSTKAKLLRATFQNHAGIIGAALCTDPQTYL